MWNTEKSRRQKAVGSRRKAESGRPSWLSRRPVVTCLLLTAFCLLPSACRQDMQDQPRYNALRASATFSDGASARPLVEGTIPRGWLREDELYYTGKMSGAQARTPTGAANTTQATTPSMQGGTSGQPSGNSNTNVSGSNAGGNLGAQQGAADKMAAQDATMFPFPITQDVLTRGQQRYNIYCSMCHGMTGYGDGMIVRRGFRRPPSYHTEQLRQAPVGHFFDVITNGWGAMPDYATQIPVQDRWAIIAYVRALQLSQQVNKSEVPPEKLKQTQSGGQTEGGGERH